MGFKDWFGSKGPAPPPDIGDLIVLEKYEEAESLLLHKIKENQRDTRSQMKLAEVYIGMNQPAKAVDQYVVVADQWAVQGFHDRSIALLYKAMKLQPDDETRSKLYRKIERFKGAKQLEVSRHHAIEGIRSREHRGDKQATIAALEVERLWFKIDSSEIVVELDPQVLRGLFGAMQVLHFEEGDQLVDAGEKRERLYFILTGLVEVISSKSPSAIRSFSSGQVIGERALFKHLPWPALYRFAERASLLELDAEGLQEALQGNPDPRGLLDTLRRQDNDQKVVDLLHNLGDSVPG